MGRKEKGIELFGVFSLSFFKLSSKSSAPHPEEALGLGLEAGGSRTCSWSTKMGGKRGKWDWLEPHHSTHLVRQVEETSTKMHFILESQQCDVGKGRHTEPIQHNTARLPTSKQRTAKKMERWPSNLAHESSTEAVSR